MANLRFTKFPERGDVVLGELKTKQVVFLKENSFNDISDIDLTQYEVLGVVFKREDNDVKFVYQEDASANVCTWCERWILALTITEGTTAGTIAVNDASSWTTFTVYTIPTTAYVDTAEGKATLVSELNAFFQDTTNPVFQTQDWVAYVDDDGKVCLNYSLVDARQAVNTYGTPTVNRGGNGFNVVNNTLTEIPATASLMRRNGNTGGAGAIGNLTRAIANFSNDINSANSNPTSNVTSVKMAFPVCLPAYLGQSIYRKDGDTQLDYCAYLRSIYGEGEKGWLKFMESCLPVYPTNWGTMSLGGKEATEYTRIMADKRYTSQKKTNEPMCKAAYYCDSITRQTLPNHSYRLPTVRELAELLDGVRYPVINNRNADVLNRSLNKLSGNAVNNSMYYHSVVRYGASTMWFTYASTGLFYSANFFNGAKPRPVSIYTLNN